MKNTNKKLQLNKQEIANLNDELMNNIKAGEMATSQKKNETKPYRFTSGCTDGCFSLWNCSKHECSNDCQSFHNNVSCQCKNLRM